MKKIMSIIFILLMMLSFNVYADSGFDASYESSSSPISSVISALSSCGTLIIQLIISKPGDEDYMVYYAITTVICIIVFLIFTNIYLFKLNDKRKKTIVVLGISLLPTLVFTSICLLTELILFIYILLLIIYIIVFKIITNKLFKKRLELKIEEIKKKDKYWNIDTINEKAFDIYKNVQLAWMNFELDKVKDVISEKIYKEYETSLNSLLNDNRKNIMDEIEFKSNEILNVNLNKYIEEIECKMIITCKDYVINKDEQVIKGKKDKINTYTYKLTFNKKINTNKYVLVEKKIMKQK